MTRRRLWRLRADLVSDWLLIFMAGALIYYQYIGTWYDPFAWIQSIEIITLWLVVILGVFRLYIHIKEVKDDKRD